MESKLSAEVARFRDASGALGLEVTTRVPRTLELGDEAIAVALIQLDARGQQVAVESQKASSTRLVRLRAVMDPATREVAVEMLGSSVNRAAAVRIPIDRRTLEGAEPAASDLQLVKSPGISRRRLSRQADLVEPLPDHAVSAGEVGLVLDLYNLSATRAYTLRVELAKAGGGAAVPLEFRPSGESRWATSFSRVPWPQPAISTEYLSVRMGNASPGQYTLRVVATLENGITIASEHPIDRK